MFTNGLFVGIGAVIIFLSINYLVQRVIRFYKDRIIKGPMVCCDGPGCIHIFGCLQRNGSVRVCALDCGREQFFACTHETDLINSGESNRRMIPAINVCEFCEYCPNVGDDDEVLDTSPIAFNSDEKPSELLAA